jgi:hypothetical protein
MQGVSRRSLRMWKHDVLRSAASTRRFLNIPTELESASCDFPYRSDSLTFLFLPGSPLSVDITHLWITIAHISHGDSSSDTTHFISSMPHLLMLDADWSITSWYFVILPGNMAKCSHTRWYCPEHPRWPFYSHHLRVTIMSWHVNSGYNLHCLLL